MEIINGVPVISVDEICWCCDITHEVHCTVTDCPFYGLDGAILKEIQM
jgi:hypothetical protein